MDLQSLCPQGCSHPRREASVGHRNPLESLVSCCIRIVLVENTEKPQTFRGVVASESTAKQTWTLHPLKGQLSTMSDLWLVAFLVAQSRKEIDLLILGLQGSLQAGHIHGLHGTKNGNGTRKQTVLHHGCCRGVKSWLCE